MVAQLCSDFDSNYGEVNKQLDKMGYNIGMRLVEDFFAKSGAQRCANFRETAEAISKVGDSLLSHGDSAFRNAYFRYKSLYDEIDYFNR